MKTSREEIYQRVFDLLTSDPLKTGLLTSASRRFRPFSMVKQGETPTLMTKQRSEDPTSLNPARGYLALPYAWEVKLWAVVYVMNVPTDPDYIPSTSLNQMLDYIESVFPPQRLATPNIPTSGVGRNTLGGLPGVYQASIDGETIFDEFDVVAPSVYAAVPITVVAL